jgi:hypothetical protein
MSFIEHFIALLVGLWLRDLTPLRPQGPPPAAYKSPFHNLSDARTPFYSSYFEVCCSLWISVGVIVVVGHDEACGDMSTTLSPAVASVFASMRFMRGILDYR